MSLFGGRSFLTAGIFLSCFFCAVAAHTMPLQASEDPLSCLDSMVGQRLSYDIGFLWFDRLAQGTFSFYAEEQPNTYRAVLEAETLGIAAWLTSDRKQRYVSVMEVTPEGRLRTVSHEAHIIKGKGAKRKDRLNRYLFDYQNNQIRYQREHEGGVYKEETSPMDEKQYSNDILTAFFNFRAGFYGPVQPGGRYTVSTFSRKGISEIVVEVFSEKNRPENDFFPKDGLLGRVFVDPEVFDTNGGWIYIWFDEKGRPARGIVENIVGMGDARGILRQ